MALTKLIIPPDQASYAVNDGKEVLSVQLDGGAGRYRRDILGATSHVIVQWTCDRERYEYLRAFYRALTVSGSLPFEIDLYLDDPLQLTTHKAYFTPETFKLVSQSGLTFVVGAELEVYPSDDILSYGVDLVLMYNTFVGNWRYYEDILNQITNIDLPADLA